MVIKTFECPECKEVKDIEMEMSCKTAVCDKCGVEMNRVFNASFIRPSGDGNGFYGVKENVK